MAQTIFVLAIKMLARLVKVMLQVSLLCLFVVLVRRSTLPTEHPDFVMLVALRGQQFNFIEWEATTLAWKAQQAVRGLHRSVSAQEGAQHVQTYLAQLGTVMQLEAQLESATAQATFSPSQIVAWQTERDRLRSVLARDQMLIESILENQVRQVLVAEGFHVGGWLFPPISMHFTQPTQLLVFSSREQIQMGQTWTLKGGTLEERERLEQLALEELDQSAIVVGIGGMAVYPAMVIEHPDVETVVDTFAHEWLHHYLMFYPLGYETELFANPEARNINETTATLFGQQIAKRVLDRYYSAWIQSSTLTNAERAQTFDYYAEMNETRVEVDRLLSQGQVAPAESYMEQRRLWFVQNGYNIRKLNQAWFAFYGGYQVQGVGIGGTDPTGAWIQSLLEISPNLKAWVMTLRSVTTRAELFATLERLQPPILLRG